MKKNWVVIQKKRHKFWHYLFPLTNFHRVPLAYIGGKTHIDFMVEISGGEHIHLGNRVKICSQAWLHAVSADKEKETGVIKIEIGDGSLINRRVIISAAQLIKIGKNVLTSPNVLIMDHNHVYEKIDVPIIAQGFNAKGPIEIEDGCWIAYNAVVLGGVKIGKQFLRIKTYILSLNGAAFNLIAC